MKGEKPERTNTMSYKLTINENITNAGANQTVKEFDTFSELQDYYFNYTKDMSEEERELLSYNSSIKDMEL